MGAPYGGGWSGTGTSSGQQTLADIGFDLGAQPVTAVALIYATGGGGSQANPGGQHIGLSNVSFEGPPPPPGADLSVTQSVDDASAPVGSNVTYTVTVSNAGPDAASVVVRDLLPSGVSYVSDDANGAYDEATGLWSVPGPLGPGETRTLRITAAVLQNGQRSNLAEVWTSNQPDADSTPGNADTDPFEDDTASTTLTPGSSGEQAGQAPQLSCAGSAPVLDWDGLAWPAGSLAQTYAASDGTAFEFAITGDTGGFRPAPGGGATPQINDEFTGGLTPAETGLYMLVDQEARADAVQIATRVGEPGVGASELQFTIFDVDYNSGQFEDRIAVAGYKGGAFVAPVVTPSSANRVENGQGIGTTGNDADQPGGNLTVTFQEPVDRFVIVYGSGPRAPSAPGQQAITLHDVTFCQATGAQLTAAKSVSVYDPLGEGLYMLPGVDARYQIDGRRTRATARRTPARCSSATSCQDDVTFWSGDVDDGGPQTGPVGFSEVRRRADAGAGRHRVRELGRRAHELRGLRLTRRTAGTTRPCATSASGLAAGSRRATRTRASRFGSGRGSTEGGVPARPSWMSGPARPY